MFLECYVELVQVFLVFEVYYYVYLGGMFDYGLEIVVYSLKLWQFYLLFIGVSFEDQVVQFEVWIVVVVYVVLFYDIGKIVVDLYVELVDGSIWYLWYGLLYQVY